MTTRRPTSRATRASSRRSGTPPDGQFQPILGPTLYAQPSDQLAIDDPQTPPRQLPRRSAYDTGRFTYVDNDLRHLLGGHPAGPYDRVYCGRGDLPACRRMLEATLRQVIARAADPASLYADPTCSTAGRSGDQECFDAIDFRPLGPITLPLMSWLNRPTHQQAIEIQGHRPR